MLCESINVTMKTTVNFYDMTIKEKREQMWVIGPHFVLVAVSEAFFLSECGLFWVGEGG